jgi:hypothetical protein
MPVPVRVATGVLIGLAVLLLLGAVVTVSAWSAVVDALADARPGSPRSDAELLVQVNVAQSTAFGLLMALSSVFLARGRTWARWSGLAATVALGLITLGTTVLAGGVAVTSQLVLVLCVAAVVSLLSPTTAAWTRPGPRSGPQR